MRCSDCFTVQKRALQLLYQTTEIHVLGKCKIKLHAEDKIYMTDILKFVLGWVEIIVGKGENACHQHFLLFSDCLQKVSFSGSLKKSLDCDVKD